MDYSNINNALNKSIYKDIGFRVQKVVLLNSKKYHIKLFLDVHVGKDLRGKKIHQGCQTMLINQLATQIPVHYVYLVLKMKTPIECEEKCGMLLETYQGSTGR